jgi:hypothetical protein
MNDDVDKPAFTRVFLSQLNQDFLLDGFWYVLLDRFNEFFMPRDFELDKKILFSRMAKNYTELSFTLIERKPLETANSHHVKRMNVTNINMERIHHALMIRSLFYAFGTVFQENRKDFEREEFQEYLKVKVSEWFFGISEPVRTSTLNRDIRTSSRPGSATSTRTTRSRPCSAASTRTNRKPTSAEDSLDESPLFFTPRNVQELLKEEEEIKREEAAVIKLQNSVSLMKIMNRVKKLAPKKSAQELKIEALYRQFDNQDANYVTTTEQIESLFDDESKKLAESVYAYRRHQYYQNQKSLLMFVEEERKMALDFDDKYSFDIDDDFIFEDKFEEELNINKMNPSIVEVYNAKRKAGIPQHKSVLFTNFSNLEPTSKVVKKEFQDPTVDEHGNKRLHFVDPKILVKKGGRYKRFNYYAKQKESPLVSQYLHDLRTSRKHVENKS